MASPLSPLRELCLITSEEERGADTLAQKDASTGDKVAEEVTEEQSLRDPSSGDSEAHELKFHSVHGTNIKIEQDGSRVVKENGLRYDGIVFSHRPISIDERVCIRLTGVPDETIGLSFGVTNIDPASLEKLPRCASSLYLEQDYWLMHTLCFSEENILKFSVSSTGKMHYIIGGQVKGKFSGIDTSIPLWVIIDVWSSDLKAVEFVDLPEEEDETSDSSMSDPSSESSDQDEDSIGDKVVEEFTEEQPSRDLSSGDFDQGDSEAQKLDGILVVRDTYSSTNGIIFSHRPISIAEPMRIRQSAVSNQWMGGFYFGVTNIDPASFKSEELPLSTSSFHSGAGWKQGNWLSWMQSRCVSITERDGVLDESIMQFFVSTNGDLHYSIDGEYKGIFLTGINTSIPLWVVVDVSNSESTVSAVEFADWSEQKKEDVVDDENEEIPSTEDKHNDASIDEEKKNEADEEATEAQSTIDSSDGGRWRRHLSSGLNAAVTGAVWTANNIELAVWIFILTR